SQTTATSEPEAIENTIAAEEPVPVAEEVLAERKPVREAARREQSSPTLVQQVAPVKDHGPQSTPRERTPARRDNRTEAPAREQRQEQRVERVERTDTRSERPERTEQPRPERVEQPRPERVEQPRAERTERTENRPEPR